MALIFNQTSSLSFSEEDLPLPSEGIEEGTRARNLSRNSGTDGYLITFKDGNWVDGWYEPYIGAVDNTVNPIDMHGLPDILAGKAGWYLTLDDNLTSWDLVAPDEPAVVTALTWAELVSKANAKTLKKGQDFIITDKSNMVIEIAYISTPSGNAFYETMTDYGQLSHTKVE